MQDGGLDRLGWPVRSRTSAAAAVLAGLVLFSCPPMSVAIAAGPDGPAIIERALNERDIDTLELQLPKLLAEGLLDQSPKPAAAAVLALARAQAAAGHWKPLDAMLSSHLDKARRALAGEGDELLLLAGNAAGGVKDPGRQEALLSRYVESVVQRTGEASQEALTARVNAAYARLTADRGKEAETAMMSALKAMEIHGQADLFFNTVGQAGDHFASYQLDDAAENIFDYGLQSRLNETDTGPGRGFLLFNVAAYMRDQKRYEDATKTGYMALNLLTAHFGGNSEYSIRAYDGLAQSMHAAGQLAAAAAAYEFLETNAVQALGKEHEAVWQVMNNRAAVLRSLKLPAAAYVSDRFAYEARFHALGGGAGETLISAVNSAHDLIEGQRYADAISVIETVSRITTGPGYNEGFRTRLQWLQRYAEIRSGEKQLDLEKVKSADLSELDGADLEVWLLFLDLYGDVAEEAKLDDLALAYRKDAMQKSLENLGDNHPMTFDAMLAYADVLGRVRPAEAADVFSDLDARLFEWTRANVSSGGSLEAARAAKILGDDAIRSLIAYAEKNERGAEILAVAADNWKSMRSATDRRLRELADDTGDEKLRGDIRQYLRRVGNLREIVSTSLFTPEMQPLADEMVKARQTLNDSFEAGEIDMAVTPWHEPKPEPFAVLPRPAKGDVVVDFISYNTWPADRGGDPLTEVVYAIIARHDTSPEVVRVYERHHGQSETLKFLAEGVARHLVGQALVKLAGEGNALYISPTAALFQFPFAELIMPDGKRLGQAVDVHVISSRDAYAHRSHGEAPAKKSDILLAGGLKYGRDAGASYLPGSRSEVREISKLAKAAGHTVARLEAEDATENRLKKAVAGKGIVHFATHGFFNDDAGLNAKLLNAGFLVSKAGAGNEAEDDGDNVVHAREVLSWDLTGADLVVISACETALSGEGATSAGRGLPVALASAGARRVLLTVEVVGDEATAAFMQRFYSFVLEKGLSYDDAFLATKRDAWAGKIRNFSPRDTAAYVFYGN
ncbi:CHAT domain-containing protein [Rhizobiales bacterium RZME27]|uniref:CHAT domain-containing protein n=1 Tax=Endobacterium cereale TaxID=2663029 RepID=A0A6A8ABD0_9HYPH|nr:CHAT domain-containing protein [Endobacterium cereale]MEB2843290.1 CHAT domain-containing protein [Endobacterium cereale]MQY47248.1 CHAT domain-containing protein [Endobacterium cereale]